MTKKHFIALADCIRDLKARDYVDFVAGRAFNEIQIEALANFCARQNSRFNRVRWICYIKGECGKNGGKVKKAKGV